MRKRHFVPLPYWGLRLSSLSTVHLCASSLNITKLPYNQSASLWDFNSVTVSSFVTIIGIFNAFPMTSKHYSNCLWNFNCLTGSVAIFINIICMLHWLQYGLAAHELRVQWQCILVIFHLFCNYMFLTLTRKKKTNNIEDKEWRKKKASQAMEIRMNWNKAKKISWAWSAEWSLKIKSVCP